MIAELQTMRQGEEFVLLLRSNRERERERERKRQEKEKGKS